KGAPLTVKGVAPPPGKPFGAGSTLQLDPNENPAAKDPNSMLDREDLPAVVARAKPARKPGQQTVPSMGAKPPPIIAPQPFGPMEKIDEAPPSSSQPTNQNPRTVAMQSPGAAPRSVPGAKNPAPAIAKRSEGKIPGA